MSMQATADPMSTPNRRFRCDVTTCCPNPHLQQLSQMPHTASLPREEAGLLPLLHDHQQQRLPVSCSCLEHSLVGQCDGGGIRPAAAWNQIKQMGRTWSEVAGVRLKGRPVQMHAGTTQGPEHSTPAPRQARRSGPHMCYCIPGCHRCCNVTKPCRSQALQGCHAQVRCIVAADQSAQLTPHPRSAARDQVAQRQRGPAQHQWLQHTDAPATDLSSTCRGCMASAHGAIRRRLEELPATEDKSKNAYEVCNTARQLASTH